MEASQIAAFCRGAVLSPLSFTPSHSNIFINTQGENEGEPPGERGRDDDPQLSKKKKKKNLQTEKRKERRLLFVIG